DIALPQLKRLGAGAIDSHAILPEIRLALTGAKFPPRRRDHMPRRLDLLGDLQHQRPATLADRADVLPLALIHRPGVEDVDFARKGESLGLEVFHRRFAL